MDLQIGNSYLFDTTVFIDVLHKHDIARKLYTQARDLPVSVGFSIITETELWVGITNNKSRTVLDHTILLKPLRRFFINVTIARRAGELRKLLLQSGLNRTDGPHLLDCIVAATAEYHDLTVCTKNARHFKMFQQFSVASISVLEYF